MKSQQDQSIVSSVIIFAIVIMLVLAITGCSTVVPVTAKFPEPPGRGAMTRCADLAKLKDDAKLSDVANTVTANYGTYYECAVRADAWQEWYEIQKRIFNGAGQ